MLCSPIDTPAAVLAEHAVALARAAQLLEHARRPGCAPDTLVAALNYTVELWAAIKTTVTASAATLPPAVTSNLDRLSDYVIGTIFRHGVHLPEPTLDALVNINTQVAASLNDGLREAA